MTYVEENNWMSRAVKALIKIICTINQIVNYELLIFSIQMTKSQSFKELLLTLLIRALGIGQFFIYHWLPNWWDDRPEYCWHQENR